MRRRNKDELLCVLIRVTQTLMYSITGVQFSRLTALRIFFSRSSDTRLLAGFEVGLRSQNNLINMANLLHFLIKGL